MSECDRFEETIRAHVTGEPVADDGGALARHAEQCENCRALLSLHGTLADLGARQAEPRPEDLAAMRSAVLREIARPQARIASRPAGSPWLAPFALRPLTAAAAAVLLFVTGFGAARIRFERPASPGQTLLREIAAEAARNRSLVDVENSSFLYSDVTFRPLDDGRVALDFDVTRHVSVVEPAESELVRDVLAQSLLNASHTGSRLRAISLASRSMAPKVRDALIFALHHDENLAVRRKALSILAEQPGADPAIEAAVLETLRGDESVQLRLEALDCLATQPRVDRQVIRRTIEETGDAAGAALMVRLEQYEKQP